MSGGGGGGGGGVRGTDFQFLMLRPNLLKTKFPCVGGGGGGAEGQTFNFWC